MADDSNRRYAVDNHHGRQGEIVLHRQHKRAAAAGRRNTFCEHAFGTASDKSAAALKAYLAAAKLTSSPTAPLDALMVEDVQHLYDLIAEEGVPLARDTIDAPELLGRSPRVTITLTRRTWVLLALGFGLVLAGDLPIPPFSFLPW